MTHPAYAVDKMVPEVVRDGTRVRLVVPGDPAYGTDVR
jgi:hypothetical protein